MEKECQILVVGGGINGCALARHAAFAGRETILLEKGDFASSTSSASSKLIHGGLRYLEQFDFSLVREATIERKVLQLQAPHLVKEQRFFFPDCEYGKHSRWAMKLGISLYEFLAGKYSLQKHTWIPSLQTHEPDFLPLQNTGAYAYSDCSTDDARLVIENALDARQRGAKLYNYTELTHTEKQGRHWVAHWKNRNGESGRIKCQNIAYCLGPWADLHLKKDISGYTSQMKLSQGTHYLVKDIGIQTSFILPVPNSSRYIFVLPYLENTLIGTTETPISNEKLQNATAQPFEWEELCSLLKLYFPNTILQKIANFSGVRPLVFKQGKNTQKLSRKHRISQLKPNLFSGIGGKYTTHRPFAQEYLERILKRDTFSMEKQILPGGANYSPTLPSKYSSRFAFLGKELNNIVQRYGGRSKTLLDNYNGEPNLKAWVSYEFQFCQKEEWVQTTEDFLRRRTSWFFQENAGLPFLPELENKASLASNYHSFLKQHEHSAL